MTPSAFRKERRSPTVVGPGRAGCAGWGGGAAGGRAGRTGTPGSSKHTIPGGSSAVWWRRPPRRSIVIGAAIAACAAIILALLLIDQMAVAATAPPEPDPTGAPAVAVDQTNTAADETTAPAPAATPGEAPDTEAAVAADQSAADTAVATGAPNKATVSTGQLFAQFPWGKGDGQVGRMNPGEGLDRGPEALAVAPDGRVAVLDSVNRRIVVLGSDGKTQGTLRVSLTNPRFLAVSNERLAVLDPDDSKRVLLLDWSGQVLVDRSVPASDQPATGLFIEGDNVWMETGHASCLLLTKETTSKRTPTEERVGRPLGFGDRTTWLSARVGSRNGSQLRQAAVSQYLQAESLSDPEQLYGAVILKVSENGLTASSVEEGAADADFGQPIEHLVSFDQDAQGRILLGARLAVTATAGRGQLIIARFAPLTADPQTKTGAGEPRATSLPGSAIVIEEATGPYLGVPFVVAPDGRVLQPVADESGYRILVHTLPEGE